MSIDWPHFTPWASLAGGLLIGISAAMFVLLNGRIAGISGIVGGMFFSKRADIGWRVAFLAGMFAAPWLLLLAMPATAPRIDAGIGTLVVAGLLVGIGTSYAGGCTSGHGVCGLSRLSGRSLVATLAFMVMGFATVYVMRHLVAAS